jgi:hypothetical protein
VAVSTLRVREHRFGRRDAWFGLTPVGWEERRGLDPSVQIAEQIHLSEEAIAGGLAALPAGRWISVDYEDLCSDPAGVVATVSALGFSRREGVGLPGSFEPSRPGRDGSDPDARRRLEEELARRFTPDEIARGTRVPPARDE